MEEKGKVGSPGNQAEQRVRLREGGDLRPRELVSKFRVNPRDMNTMEGIEPGPFNVIPRQNPEPCV